MTFEELLDEACRSASLPDMARTLLPSTLSDQTKKRVMRLGPEELGRILSSAIETINKGSAESIDVLVRKKLNLD